VLDIGVGAGRTTRYLAPVAHRYEAVDYSPVMVEYFRSAFPENSVNQADFRSLDLFADQSFDFVFAPDNVIDALSHDDRMRALGEAHRVLRVGGVLAFSCHNVRYEKAYEGPTLEWCRNPITLAHRVMTLLTMIKNHRRVGPLRKTTDEYALLNDVGQNFACLHYYASREAVQAQLERSGMRLLDVFDAEGSILPEGRDATSSPSLLYVAERVAER
jgi:ubiquinone/menaquinone biosynthesis C-methylase UbiE